MTRYKLPDVLGGGEFDGEMLWSGCAGAVPDYALHVPGIGEVRITTSTPLEEVDTTPAEPEPGAWDIGGVIAVCVSRGEWRVPSRETPGPEGWSVYRFLWPTVWEKLGGSGITPRRLVPMPEPVELPWDPNPLDVDNLDQTRTSVRAASDGWIHDENVVSRVGNVLRFTSDDAEAKGWALISAAHAAREVKP